MKTTLATALAAALCVTPAGAQLTNRSSVLDGSGTRASGGALTNLSAAGQPGGIGIAAAGPWVNQAGFLNTFFLKPALDHDGDGLADEADRDNDNDTLSDYAELAGSSFDPSTATYVNLADSDGDGASDGAEALAGTNPMDGDALLELVRIARAAAVSLAWVARSNKTYRVVYAANPTLPLTNELTTVVANGPAAPPWYALTNTVNDPAAPTGRVYGVLVLP